MNIRNARSGFASLVVLSVLVATGFVDCPSPSQPIRLDQPALVRAFGNLPLSFEANQGQTDDRVDFVSRGRGYTLFLAADEAVLRLADARDDDVVRMRVVGANGDAAVSGERELSGRVYYLTGNRPSDWLGDVRRYARVAYDHVYPGIDLLYYGNSGELEFDFVVSAGAAVDRIALAFEGTDPPSVDENGDLLLRRGEWVLRQHAPRAYQESGGARIEVAAAYKLRADGSVGFDVTGVDAGLPLVIDPVLDYSTYLGGPGIDRGLGIVVDAEGNAYVSGETTSIESPLEMVVENTDIFVAKIDPTGTNVLFSTYIGGSLADRAHDIALDDQGGVYITGETQSLDFPMVAASQPTFGGGDSDAFVARLSADGSTLVLSTYIGGQDRDGGFGIDVDDAGSIFIAGETSSLDFPASDGPQPTSGGGTDAFAVVVPGTGSVINFCTFLGGSAPDHGRGVVAWGNGQACIAGWTESADFPTANAMQATYGGGDADGFVIHVNAVDGTVGFATYVGGQGNDRIYDVAVDNSGRPIVTGTTDSGDFMTVGALQSSLAFGYDAFVARLSADGSALEYSTFLGGRGSDVAFGVATDNSDRMIVVGSTTSPDFPLAEPIQPEHGGISDGFIACISAPGDQLVFSTFLGGERTDPIRDVAIGPGGAIYVVGTTQSRDYPRLNALQNGLSHLSDSFIAKISVGPPDTTFSVSVPPDELLPVGTQLPILHLHGFGIANTSSVDLSFDYQLSEEGPAWLDDAGDPASLVGTTPVLLPGETYYPPDADLHIPSIRDHTELLVHYSVQPAGRPDLEDVTTTTITVEPPVAVFVTAFTGRAAGDVVELEWDIVADELVRGFRVYRSDSKPGANVPIGLPALLPAEQRRYVDEDVAGGHTYRYTLAVVSEDGDETLSPVVIVQTPLGVAELGQNHPNPFNPSTEISFRLPSSQEAELSVFDARGRLVRVLARGVMSEGFHQVPWDGTGVSGAPVSSGVYFYRLRTGGRALTKKMLLLK